MPKNTNKHKAIKNLPPVKPPNLKIALPFNGEVVKEKMLSFSFSALDLDHEYFNLGGAATDKTVGGKWFLDLLKCLKSVSQKTIPELKNSMYKLHPVDWENANVKCPDDNQAEYWQLRINKSRGRVIGKLIDNIFYIIWLDPHHNLTNSEGYGTVKKFPKP